MAIDEPHPSTPPPRRRRRWPVVLAAIVLGFVALLVALPFFVDWYATRWLKAHGLVDASIEDVDIDLFRGRVGLDGLVLTDTEDSRTRATRTFVNFRWQGLFRERLVLGRMQLTDAEITVRRDEARDFFIADFLVAAGERQEQVEEGEESGFDFGILAVDFRNVLVRYRGTFFQEDVLFEELRLGQVATWDPEAVTPLTVRARIDGREHLITGEVRPLAAAPGADLTLRFDQLDLAPFARMMTDAGITRLGGRLSADTTLKTTVGVAPDPTTVESDGRVALSGFDLVYGEAQFDHSDIEWEGAVSLTQTEPRMEVGVAGRLRASPLAVTLPGPAAESGDGGAPAAPISVTADGIDFEARELRFTEAGDGSALSVAGLLGLETLAFEQGATRASLGAFRWDGRADLDLGGDVPVGRVAGGLTLEGLEAAAEAGRVTASRVTLADTELALAPGGRADGLTVTTRAALVELNVGDGDASAQINELGWSGTADLDLTDDGPAGRVEGTLQVDGVAGGSERLGLEGGIGSLAWQGAVMLGHTEAGAGLGDGRMEIASLAVGRKDPLLELLALDDFEAALGSKGDGAVSLSELAAGAVRVLQRPDAAEGEASHVLRIDGIGIDRLDLSPTRTDIGAVTLDGLALWAQQGRDGPEVARIVAGLGDGETADGTGTESNVEAEPDAASSTFRIGSVATSAPGSLRFIDRSVRPVVDFDLQDLTIALGTLDSAAPRNLTKLSFSATTGAYTKLSYEGELSPLADRLTLYGDGRIESLDMPELAGYQAKSIGYVARSGSLDAELDLKVEQDILDSRAELQVRQLDLERVVAAEDDEFTADLGVPMDTALGLLKDKNGLIALTVPVEGDLADLSVGIGDALRKVWAKGLQVAMTHAATTFFAPLLPAIAVTKIVGMANKVRFQPVAFAPGSTEIGSDQDRYLDEMADILNGRPDVDVVLCAVSVPGELAATAAPVAPAAGGDVPTSTADDGAPAATPAVATAGAESESALIELGDEREKSVKDALVDKGVSASRVVLCTPEIDAEPGATPRVEIGV